ncbi:MAG: sulfur carrier protein ThiS, partial [Candidatus Omnitrophica bacterium]|nr:sulfur carrier protein ThiS [Candidatus Omnitrophota bacterium]
MKLKINGKEELIDNIITVFDLITFKNLNPLTVVVEHNRDIIPRENWNKTILKGE